MNKKQKNLISIFLIGAAVLSMLAGCGKKAEKEPEQMTAWWGTLYPEFCFSDIPEGSDRTDIKISFWLAHVLNW